MDNKKINVQLASLNPFIETNIVENISKKIQGKDFVIWGDNNKYPNYLNGLYKNVPTLQSAINTLTDYIVGNGISTTNSYFSVKVNNKGETLEDVVTRCVFDYVVYGGFSLQILRNNLGNVSEIYYIDFANVRTDEKREIFYYSEDWNKSYGRVKYITYPKFNANDSNPSSILYFVGNTKETYPTPLYGSAIIACEIEKAINQYSLNEINNNFLTTKIINFNNGVPDDELKIQIERELNEKFSGYQNAGRLMVSFNDGRENETSITDLGSDNLVDRYNQLADRCKKQIFIAFRATPNLLGDPTETTGFNSQEFAEAFKLFSRTVVNPMQRNIIRQLETVLGKDTVTIEQFSI